MKSFISSPGRPAPAALFPAIGKAGLVIGVFLAGFVNNEPAPYELFMAVLVPAWFLVGLRLSSGAAFLCLLLVLLNVGGLLSLTTVSHLQQSDILYAAVSLFLAMTAVFIAAVVEEDAERLTLVFNAYLSGAVISAMLGILGYFGLIPSAQTFTLYDRARGGFQDPNVFGPFLVLPACYVISRMLTGRLLDLPWQLVILTILSFGIFLSFSRATWGLFVVCAAAIVLLLLVKERSKKLRLRAFLIGLFGFLAILTSIVVALQFDQISDLFRMRLQVQEYDIGQFGRFARYAIGLDLALQNPFGLGPLGFGGLYGEDTHNIWLKALLGYGWIGFASLFALVICTLAVGFRCLFRERPWQSFLLCAYVVFLGHILMATFIDVDHWRHFYIILGVVWGCVGLEHRHQRKRRRSVAGFAHRGLLQVADYGFRGSAKTDPIQGSS